MVNDTNGKSRPSRWIFAKRHVLFAVHVSCFVRGEILTLLRHSVAFTYF